MILAAQRHDRLQPGVGDVLPLPGRRRAIQHDAWTNPVKMRFRMPEGRRRVGQRARAIQPLRRLFDTAHRLDNSLRVLRLREVRHQRHLADVAYRPQLLPDGVDPLRHKAQPVHAAVHLEIDIQRRAQLRLLQGLNLPVAVDAGG